MPYKDPDIRKAKAAERWKKWAGLNPEAANKRMKNWRERNPKYMMYHSAKRRSKDKGVTFSIEMDDIPDLPDVCPITGEEFLYRTDGKSGPLDQSPSLDRVDPTKGYVKGNLAIISHKANRWKSNMTVENLETLLRYMKNSS